MKKDKKKIAIVTGASSGLGKEFVRLLIKEELDEIWAVARNKEKLSMLQEEFGDKIITISKDLSNKEEVHSFEAIIAEEKPQILFLVNSAGIGKMGTYSDFTLEEIEKTIYLNCNTMVLLCTMCIPYMSENSNILNLSSQSSFQPVAYLNIYAATKAFERSYSRALHMELKDKKITVTAVCPGWVDTDLLIKESGGKTIKFPGIVSADRVVEKAIKDARKGRDMSVCSAYVKFMRFYAKVLPEKFVMNSWVKSIKKYW